MTVSRPCYFGNLLLGVVGVDVNLAYILEDVTYYQDSLASYTFLIDNKGMDTNVREQQFYSIVCNMMRHNYLLRTNLDLTALSYIIAGLGFKTVYLTPTQRSSRSIKQSIKKLKK